MRGIAGAAWADHVILCLVSRNEENVGEEGLPSAGAEF